MPKPKRKVVEVDKEMVAEAKPQNSTDTGKLDINFNVFLGSDAGLLKGVYFGEETPKLRNFHTFKADKEELGSIVRLSWADEDESQQHLLVAYKNHAIKIYNRKLHAFTHGFQLELGEGKIVGIYPYDGNFMVGVESGEIMLWDFHEQNEKTFKIQTGGHLASLKQCPFKKSLFATGGKENDLKIWDLSAEDPTVPVFKAKNVAHDELDLRVPVWVQDLTYMPQSDDLVATCSRYGKVRLYDTRASQRPIISFDFVDHPLMAISTTRNDREVIVGSSRGKMGLIDLRNPGKGEVVRHYIGASGGYRSISAQSNGPHFVSCGLDRHLYLHHVDQSKFIKKLYLRSTLNCTVMTNDFCLDNSASPVKPQTPVQPQPSSVWQNIDMNPSAVSESMQMHSAKKKLKLRSK